MADKPGSIQDQLDKQRRRVDVDHFDITVRELVRMATEGELKRAPEYQRKFRWDETDESRLIESLFLGFPVPSIFVATNTDGTWELVDGLQRVSTLMHYLVDALPVLSELDKIEALRLSGLEKLSLFNDLTFSQLSVPIQLHFNKRSIRVTVLSDKSDPEIRFDTFERLNNGGIALSPQEVRACIYRGMFSDFIRELASTPDFRKLVKLQRKRQHDGTMEEIVLKFFAYLYDRNSFAGNVKGFLTDYMKKASVSFNYDENRGLFNRVIICLLNITGGPLQRQNVNVTPINQLEAVMLGAATIMRSGAAITNPPPDWLEDAKLVQSCTGATNTRPKLRDRISRAVELLSGKA